MRALFLALALLLIGTTPATSDGPPPVLGAMVFTDLAIATVYKAGGVVRTANHVAPLLIFVGIPGESADVAHITCTHESTDSATLTTKALMRDYDVGMTPPLGATVVAIGLLGGAWPPRSYTTTIDTYSRHRRAEQTVVGPMIGMPFSGRANGMSGGPILYHGKAVATISMFGDDHLYAVPIERQHCPIQ